MSPEDNILIAKKDVTFFSPSWWGLGGSGGVVDVNTARAHHEVWEKTELGTCVGRKAHVAQAGLPTHAASNCAAARPFNLSPRLVVLAPAIRLHRIQSPADPQEVPSVPSHGPTLQPVPPTSRKSRTGRQHYSRSRLGGAMEKLGPKHLNEVQ